MSEPVVSVDGDRAVLTPNQDLLTSTTGVLRPRLKDMLQAGARTLDIDLANVRAVDSAGIGLLIATHNSLRKVGGTLSIINASPDVLDLFRSVRLNQHFSITGR